MSDEFDKEAEKERLREQLAEEEADRQTTQHMSELLLKGATMTNRHCDNCGDPLFRHEGRVFCPTCGWEPGREATGAPEGGEPPAGAATAAEDAGGGGEPTRSSTETGIQPAGSSGTRDVPRSQPTPAEADLPAARESLARTVTKLAREAEATGDVGRARELLAAVREGAEAIRALDGTGR